MINKNHLLSTRLLSASVLALMAAAAPAYAAEAAPAQPQPAAEQAAPAQSGGLGDIVVTAQRREQKLQDVPVAVTAFNQATITQLHLTDAIATSKFVPGMISQHNAGLASANSYYLRGLGNSQSVATFDAPVTTYVDDVYIARQNANNYAFFDTERVEILRGPQGTLFGRNTTGGAINVIMRKPADHFGASLEATGGSYDRYTVKGTVDVPLSPFVLTKLSGYYVSDKGYLHNITTGQTLNGENNWGLRGDVRFKPTDGLTMDVSAEYTRNTATYSGVRTVAGASPYVVGGTTVPAFYTTASGLYNTDCTSNNVNTLLTREAGNCSLSINTAITAKISYDTGAGTIDYIGGWRHLNQGYINEYNANATNKYAGYIIVDNGTNDEWSQEVKYNTSLFDDRVKLTTGAFYMQEISNDRSTTFTGGTTAFNPTGDTIYRFKAQTAAYYAQGDIKLTDALTLTLGGRYTWEEKTLHFTPSSQFSGLGFGDTQVQSYGIPLKLTTNRFTPRVAVSYKVTPAIMLFASATNGFKSGGWNALITKASQALSFRPEKTWSYEAGFKSDWFDHKLRLNVTGYLANTDDLQASAAILVQGTTASLSFNAGTQRVYGVEVESSAKLGNLTIFANPSFMHGEYTYISPQALTLTTALSPVRTPTFQFSGGATYEKPVEAIKGSLGATLAYRHNSSYWVSVLNTTHTLTEDYLDLGAYYRTSDDRLTVGVDVTNLFNQTTVTANFLSLFPGEPRRVTARVKLKI